MSDTSLAFKAYQRTSHRWEGFSATHGCYDGLTTGPCQHEHLQILVPLKGRIHLALAGETHLLGPERAIALMPGTPHEASTLGGVFEFLALNAPAAWLEALPGSLGLVPWPARPGPRAVLLADPGVWLQARQLANALDSPLPGFEPLLQAGLVQLGVYVARAIGLPPAEPVRPGAIARAVSVMVSRYASPLSMAQLADECALGSRQFERRFKAEMGMTPRRFLIEVRLAAARELLASGGAAIEAVAAQVGFHDPSHFARSFRQASGLSPGAYRRLRGGAPAEPVAPRREQALPPITRTRPDRP